MTSYKTSWRDGEVSLRPSSTDLKGDGTIPTTFIGKRQRQLAGEARAVLSIASPRDKITESGLVYYKDEHRHASITFDSSTSAIIFEVVNRGKRESIFTRKTICIVKESDDRNIVGVEFRLAYAEQCLEFAFRLRSTVGALEQQEATEASWEPAGIVETLALTDQDFTGPCIGLFATLVTTSSNADPDDLPWCNFSEVSLLG